MRGQLLARFGTAAAALQASSGELLEVPGFGRKLLEQWRSVTTTFVPTTFLAACESAGIQVHIRGIHKFPRMLNEIHDPPTVLYIQGTTVPQDEMAVAIVGTRRATSYGLRQAARFGQTLARCGLTVVSGLARGIDAAAHRAALEAGGRTIAVLGSGLLEIYPPEHRKLAAEIANQGALMSELQPKSRPRSGSFPRRNRLVSGLSLAVLVVEAAGRSGALITARHALEQNREVMAIPGRIDQVASQGCHSLIRDGAKLVMSIDDVLEELGPLTAPIVDDGREIRQPAELILNDQEKAIVFAISDEGTQIDGLAERCGLPIQRVLATLSALEARRLVRRIEGNRVIRV